MNLNQVAELAKSEAIKIKSGEASEKYLDEIENHLLSPIFLDDMGEKNPGKVFKFLNIYKGFIADHLSNN